MNIVHITCPRCASHLGTFEYGTIKLTKSCNNCNFKIIECHKIPILYENKNVVIDKLEEASKLPKYNSLKLNIPFIDKALNSGLNTLQIGGGLDSCTKNNMIKSDAYLYSKKMDIIADAHSLPFDNESFSYVYALAVFEHLHSPWIAADEIFRVLKPGGKVFILTAFMQHMHGYPDHYFNMTISGAKRIFNNFRINYVKPSKHTSFDQISYIMIDYVKLLNQLKLSGDLFDLRKKINKSLQEFCLGVEKFDTTLLNHVGILNENLKIAPTIELLATKE